MVAPNYQNSFPTIILILFARFLGKPVHHFV
jgi:hypothetical protein